jgi:virginiamycin B lyase
VTDISRALRRVGVGTALVLVCSSCGASNGQVTSNSPSSPAIDSTSASPQSSALRQVPSGIPVGLGPNGVGIGFGSVWVVNHQDGTVSRIDPATSAVVATIPAGNGPGGAAAGFGSVWLTNFDEGSVSRIDPDTQTAVTLPLGGDLASPAGTSWNPLAAFGSIWVGQGGDLVKLDPDSGSVADRLTLGSGKHFVVPLSAGFGLVWAAAVFSGRTVAIDPGTMQVKLTLPYGWVVTGQGMIWAVSDFGDGARSGEVVRLDPASHEVIARVQVGSGPTIFIDSAAVWVVGHDAQTAIQIDPKSNLIVQTVHLGTLPGISAVGFGSLWVPDFDSDTVLRIEEAL